MRHPADDVDRALKKEKRIHLLGAVRSVNDGALADDADVFYCQQLLLSRIYGLITQVQPGPTAEGSVVIHEVTRMLENATLDAGNRIDPGELDAPPTQPAAYLS